MINLHHDDDKDDDEGLAPKVVMIIKFCIIGGIMRSPSTMVSSFLAVYMLHEK